MLPIGHFAFGAGMMTLLITLLIPAVQYPRLLAILGGFWAIVPDIGRVIAHPMLQDFSLLHGADVFWLHHSLSVLVDPNESYVMASAMIVFFIIATFVAEVREFKAAPPVTPVVQERGQAVDAYLTAAVSRFVDVLTLAGIGSQRHEGDQPNR